MDFARANVAYAPYISFGLLLLAGLNLPASEDALIFLSAYLASENPSHKIPLFLGVYLGAYCSDLISYSLGRFLGPKLQNIKLFSKVARPKKIKKLEALYERYGVGALLVGRFIPFGVRNGLFLTAGMGRMNFLRFALVDWVAATASCSLFFFLYYTYGHSILDAVKRANVAIFSLAILGAIIFFWKRRSRRRAP